MSEEELIELFPELLEMPADEVLRIIEKEQGYGEG